MLLRRPNREFILGDLDEMWVRRAASGGRLSADLRYVSDVLRSALVRPIAPRPAGLDRSPLAPRSIGLVSALIDDLRSAFRALRRRPRFALVVVVTIALGIGPTAAVFGLVQQILLRPLPGVPHHRSAAYLELHTSDGSRSRLSPAEFDAVRARATLLEGVASYGPLFAVISLDGGRIRQILAASIYGDFFDVLGVTPSSGRLLSAAETGFDADPFAVVISEQLRDELFGPGTQVVGRTVVLDGQPFSIVGVAGGGFSDAGEAGAMAWVPLAALLALQSRNRERMLAADATAHLWYLVRPRPGVTTTAAQAQIQEIVDQLREGMPQESERPRELTATLFQGLWPRPSERESARSMVRSMALAVAFMLAVACANVANLLLFRNATRTHLVATRRALGATPGRIGREQLAETMVLATGGAVVGIVVAKLMTVPFEGQRVSTVPALEALSVDWSMVAFLGVVSLGSALLFGVVPAILAGRAPLAPLGGAAAQVGRHGFLRGVLSASQLALTLALVVGGLLMFRTLRELRAVDTGADVNRVLRVTMGGSLSPGQFFRLPPEERHRLQRRLLAAVRDVPGVESAALDHQGPFSAPLYGQAQPADAPDAEPQQTRMRAVTPEWFELFGVATLHGRTFTESDWQLAASQGVVLTASLALRLFGRTDVSGRHVLAGPRGQPEEHIVLGVVEDLRSPANPAQSIDQFFVTYDHFGDPDQWSVMVRARELGPDVAQRIRDAAASVLPLEQYIHEPFPLNGVDEIRAQEVLVGRLLWILGLFAVLLSGVGLFASVAFVVSQRNRELGIRIALGADRASVLGLVLRSTYSVVLSGVLFGLGGAYVLGRVIRSRLFEVTPLDPSSYLVAAAMLAAVTAAACFLPARTALRTDPGATLREE